MTLEQGRGINKNQSTGSAMTYGQRYSLIQVLGLTTCQSDDDGRSSGRRGPPPSSSPPTPKMSTDGQRKKIMAMARERALSDDARHAGMKKRYGVASVKLLTYEQAGDMIERLVNVPIPPKDADLPDEPELPELQP